MLGGSPEDLSVQTAAMIKQMGKDERKLILANLQNKIVIPPEHVASMKATFNLPWNQMREIASW